LFGWLTSFFSWLAWPITSLPEIKRGRVLFWLLQALLVLVVVLVLLAINNLTGLYNVVFPPWLSSFGLHRVWLPLLFLAGYVLFWLVLWLWSILGPDREAGEFDDIEAAWAEARRQLDEAGANLRETPVFLVLGRPGAGALESFYAATGMRF